MVYLHYIYTSCPEVQKTRRTGTERETLLDDAEFIIFLNNNKYSTTKEKKTTILCTSKESGLEETAKPIKSMLMFPH